VRWLPQLAATVSQMDCDGPLRSPDRLRQPHPCLSGTGATAVCRMPISNSSSVGIGVWSRTMDSNQPHHALWVAVGGVLVVVTAPSLVVELEGAYPPGALVAALAVIGCVGVYAMVGPFLGLPLPRTRSNPIWQHGGPALAAPVGSWFAAAEPVATLASPVLWSPQPSDFTAASEVIEADPWSMVAVGEPKLTGAGPIRASRFESTLPIRVDALGGLSGERIKSPHVWDDWIWTVKELVLTNPGSEILVVTPYLRVPSHWMQKSTEETSEERLTEEEGTRAITVPANDVARVSLRFTLPLWPLSPEARANPMFGGRGLVTLNLLEVGGNRAASLEFNVDGFAKLPRPRLRPPGTPAGLAESGSVSTPPLGVTCLLPIPADKAGYYIGCG
jgi:hypothetical protein